MMSAIQRAARRVSGEIMMVTSRNKAEQDAIKRLNNNPQDLIDEIEQDIKRQRGEMYVHARGGDYTPEVVEDVAAIYRAQGWRVDTRGYWMHLE